MKLSIIIPAYNVEKYITNTLNSLLYQDEKDFEIIIIDDGSTDNTYEIVNEVLKDSKLIYKIIKTDNYGVSAARNKGLNEASGNYVMFLDGDDYVSNELVSNLYKYVEQKPEVICWGYNHVNEEKHILDNYFDKYSHLPQSLSGIDVLNNIIIDRSMWIWTGSVVFKKEFLSINNLKYTVGCSNGEDQEFLFKVLSRANNVIFIDKVLSYYLQRQGSISNSYNIKRFEVIEAMKRAHDYIISIDNHKLNEIAVIVNNESILENYLHNFNSCLSYLQKGNGLSNKESLNYIYKDIEETYPGMTKKMLSVMNNYNGNDIKLLFKLRVFLISPLILNWINNIKNKTLKK